MIGLDFDRAIERRQRFDVKVVGDLHFRTGDERSNSFVVVLPPLLADFVIRKDVFEACDLIVDAILGTGSRGTPRGLERRAIDLINGSRAAKVSIDVPSGLDCDTGVCSGCVLPDLVVTFHAPKKGVEMYNYVVADIGIPEKAYLYVGPGDLANIRTRGDCAHKGACGRVLVVGGGPYTGAPALVAMAALRAGAGWVTVAAPQRAADIVASFSPDLITVPLVDQHKIVMADVDRVARLIGKHDVVVVGNGAGRDMETKAALAQIIRLCEKVVIDADAIQPDMPLRGIITPHPGEFARVGGTDMDDLDTRPAVVKFSARHGVVTLLKSKVNVISDGRRVRLKEASESPDVVEKETALAGHLTNALRVGLGSARVVRGFVEQLGFIARDDEDVDAVRPGHHCPFRGFVVRGWSVTFGGRRGPF
jgi:NAD(P)H-hydrate epimerase